MSDTELIRREPLWTLRLAPFILSALALELFIAFEAFAVTTVLPVAMAELNGHGWYSMAFAATITAGLVGFISAGSWIDFRGVRSPLLVGGALFILGIAACALAPNAPIFVLGRFVQGFGGGIVSVVLYVLIARKVSVQKRPTMFGLLSAAWLLPSLAGPLVAGYLAEVMSWRTIFWLVLLGSTVALICLLTVAVRPAPADDSLAEVATSAGSDDGPKGERRRIVIAVSAAAALAALHFAGQLPRQWGMAALIVGVIGLILAARVLLPRGTLTFRGAAPRLVALRTVLGATVTACDVHLTLFLQDQRGFAATSAGLVIASGAGGWAAGSWVQARFESDHRSERRLLALAAPLVACGPVAVLGCISGSLAFPFLIVGCVLMGTGMGIAYPRIASAILRITDSREHGRYSSSLQASESMGSAALLAMIGILLASFAGDSGFVVSYGLLAALGAVGVVAAWWPDGSRDGSMA